jgi:hypothetical protein
MWRRLSAGPSAMAAKLTTRGAGTRGARPVSLTLLRTKSVSLDDSRLSPTTPEGPSDESSWPGPRRRGGGLRGARPPAHAGRPPMDGTRVGSRTRRSDPGSLLKAFAAPRFPGESPARAWLSSIADNAVKNRYRALGASADLLAFRSRRSRGFRSGSGPEENSDARASRAGFVAEALKRIPTSSAFPSSSGTWRSGRTRYLVSLALPVGTVKSRIARDVDSCGRFSFRCFSDEGAGVSRAAHPAVRLTSCRASTTGLTPSERAHFESHRSHCDECRRAAADFERHSYYYRTAGTTDAQAGSRGAHSCAVTKHPARAGAPSVSFRDRPEVGGASRLGSS